jgi:glycolate oxidase
LGLKAVLADGEVVQLGGESLENTGPDLAGLFVGSEGLFGIAIEITLRLMVRPEAFRTILAAYHSLQAAGQTVSQIVASGLLPGAIEIMDNLAIRAAEAAVSAGYPLDAAGLLIVELDGEAASVQADYRRLMEIMDASGAYLVSEARNDAERMRFWKGRKSAFSAVGRLSSDYLVQDGVVPRGRLGEALTEIQRLSAQYDLRVANVFHAGDGNLHPLILFDGRQEGAYERAEQLAGDILRLCVNFGGSITGEHGVGLEKRSYLPIMFSEADLDMLQAIHHQMDPLEIANRGKMFPTA